MRKILLVLAIVVIICASAMAYNTWNGQADNHEYVYSRIQKEYGIELTERDVMDMTYEPAYSRDFSCVASIELSEEYAHALEERIRDDVTWLPACKAEEIIAKYIEPSLSSFESLSALRSCCMKYDSYLRLIVFEEEIPYVQRFSILVVNPSDAELFYFTVR